MNKTAKYSLKILLFGLLLSFSIFLSGYTYAQEEEAVEEIETSESVAEGESSFNLKYPYDPSVVRSRDFLDFDNQISETVLDEYKEVEKIHVIYVNAPSKDIQSDGEEWVKGLYYYLITKENFPDIPFNFVVTHDGFAYQGKYGAADVQPFAMSETDSSGILTIAYLGYGENFDIDYAGQEKLKDLLGYLRAYYSLNSSDIIASDWEIQKSDNIAEPSVILLKGISGNHRWSSQINEIVVDGLVSYSNLSRDYEVEVSNVTTDESAEVGGRLGVVVKVTNNGNFPIYADTQSSLVLYVEDKEESSYFINKEWLSPEAVAQQSEDFVLTGESASFVFDMAMPFAPGEYTETFELGTLSGDLISGSAFKVSFEVTGDGSDLVEILETGYGYLNLRDAPSYYSDVLGTVQPGNQYLLIEEGDTYYKIQTFDGTQGWVSKKYAKIIN